MITVGSLEPTRWQGRIDPCKLSSDLYMSSVGLGERKRGREEREAEEKGGEEVTVTICAN